MEKAPAEVILKSVLSLGKGFNDLDPIARDVKDLDERMRLLKCLGVVMSELNAHIVIPIINQYPETDPDPPESTQVSRWQIGVHALAIPIYNEWSFRPPRPASNP